MHMIASCDSLSQGLIRQGGLRVPLSALPLTILALQCEKCSIYHCFHFSHFCFWQSLAAIVLAGGKGALVLGFEVRLFADALSAFIHALM